jgi:spermidine synthase
LLAILAILFFGSGVSALVDQVLWIRMLGLTFGVTIYAASTVSASFMAGLALRSLAAGRLADRVRRPLAWFGAAELLIGATALATPGTLAWLQQAYVRVYPSLPASRAALQHQSPARLESTSRAYARLPDRSATAPSAR